MELTTAELIKRARRVAKLYNGTVAPRAVQLEAMKDLQDFIYALDRDASISQPGPTTVPASSDSSKARAL